MAQKPNQTPYGLVNDLLDVSRIQAGRLVVTLQRIDLGALIHEVQERFTDLAHSSKCLVSSDLEPDVFIRADQQKFEQVVENLMANACKYAPGKKIHVSLKRIGDCAHLTVEDGGPGIPMEQQAQIFDRFERVDTKRSVAGLGLGLYITRQIVTAHNGSISVVSQPGSGASFCVEVPVVTA